MGAALPGFPISRPRRLRRTEPLRRLVQETRLHRDQFILPLFLRGGSQQRIPIRSMPGVFQLSIDAAIRELAPLIDLGLRSVLLFGIPDCKDATASGAYAEDGIVQKGVRELKKAFPHLLVITDVCLCEYTHHGHCGVVDESARTGHVQNDATLEILARTALSHAQAGADLVAPSDMMDGRIGAIRKALDTAHFEETPILSYAAKFASAFYGPFRDAAESAPQFGDRRSYQMNAANAEEAMREVALDVQEGADLVMVKPGLAYLDLVHRIKQTFQLPTAVYAVSGEYSMVKAAAERAWIDERRVFEEMFLGMKRAGADLIITYATPDVLKWEL